jgi:hypothetical protein
MEQVTKFAVVAVVDASQILGAAEYEKLYSMWNMDRWAGLVPATSIIAACAKRKDWWNKSYPDILIKEYDSIFSVMQNTIAEFQAKDKKNAQHTLCVYL